MHDLNTDDLIDVKELVMYLKHTAFPQRKFTSQEIEEIFNSIDKDGNGFISKAEMVQFFESILTNLE